MNYYSILGLQFNASQDEVKKAYKKLAMVHHPDKNGDKEQFRKIHEAYKIISKRIVKAKKHNLYQQQVLSVVNVQKTNRWNYSRDIKAYSSCADTSAKLIEVWA